MVSRAIASDTLVGEVSGKVRQGQSVGSGLSGGRATFHQTHYYFYYYILLSFFDCRFQDAELGDFLQAARSGDPGERACAVGRIP